MVKRIVGTALATVGAVMLCIGALFALAVWVDSSSRGVVGSQVFASIALLIVGGGLMTVGVRFVKFGAIASETVGPPEPGQIAAYSVVYIGGHPDYPTSKHAPINFIVLGDRFALRPGAASKTWFQGLTLPFDRVRNFEIVERQVGTVEGLLGGLDSRQLNQRNNIHISYVDDANRSLVLRLEMLTGFTVMGQAAKCKELLDRLQVHQIRERFGSFPREPHRLPETSQDILSQIEKLASLQKNGVLSQSEFEKKKAELLSRL